MTTLVLIVAVMGASPAALSSSQVTASNGPVKIFLPLMTSGPFKTFLPQLARPAVVTTFGTFLDADGRDNGLAQMKAAGASWVRIGYSWSKVEASAGQRAWEKVATVEKKLIAISNSSMNAILYIDETPAWALKAGYPCGAVSQDKFGDLTNFLTDLVTRYSAPPFNVKYYELWNEPDVAGALGCWGDPRDANYYGGGYYGEMLKAAYPVIKAADPQAQVLFGGLLMNCNPDHIDDCLGDPALNTRIAHFLEGALADGAEPYFDGISFHAYDYYGGGLGQYSNANWGTAWNTTGPVVLAKAAYLSKLLVQFNVTGKYLMNTEFAVLCGRTGKEAPCVTDDHAQTVSAYIVQAMTGGNAFGLKAMVWFSAGGWRGSGLLDSNLNPLPPYNAFKAARARLGEATFVRAVTDFNGVQGFEFNSNGRRLWVLWSVTATGNPHTVALGTPPAAVYDIYGNAMPAGAALDVGLMPVYVAF